RLARPALSGRDAAAAPILALLDTATGPTARAGRTPRAPRRTGRRAAASRPAAARVTGTAATGLVAPRRRTTVPARAATVPAARLARADRADRAALAALV